jgi:hypothetical protein
VGDEADAIGVEAAESGIEEFGRDDVLPVLPVLPVLGEPIAVSPEGRLQPARPSTPTTRVRAATRPKVVDVMVISRGLR